MTGIIKNQVILDKFENEMEVYIEYRFNNEGVQEILIVEENDKDILNELTIEQIDTVGRIYEEDFLMKFDPDREKDEQTDELLDKMRGK